MLAGMLRKLELLVPSLVAGTLVLGFSAPAFADVAPRRPREEPPAPQPEPTPEPNTEAPEQPETEAEAPKPREGLYEVSDAEPPPEKAEAKPEAKAEAKKAEDKKSGNCSIDDSDDRNILGLAALVLVISGAALRRRSR